MELFLGFVLGCIASMLATIFINAIPAYRQRPLLSLLRNPRLFIQLRRDSEQKKIKALIDSLFRAWEEKNLQKYMACWSNDAVRVVGPTNTVVDHLPEIGEGFKKSIARYRTIRVLSAVIEDIDIRPTTPDEAMVEAHYRFQLTREPDLLPVHEEATEFYVLRRTEQQGWLIASNLDHSKDVAKG
jgi:uncharacterized protein (TIGR02246 family)